MQEGKLCDIRLDKEHHKQQWDVWRLCVSIQSIMAGQVQAVPGEMDSMIKFRHWLGVLKHELERLIGKGLDYTIANGLFRTIIAEVNTVDANTFLRYLTSVLNFIYDDGKTSKKSRGD